MTRLYNIAKPFVWHRHEGAGSVVVGRERQDDTQDDQARVIRVDEML